MTGEQDEPERAPPVLHTEDGAPLLGAGGGDPDRLMRQIDDARAITDVEARAARLYFLGRALADCDGDEAKRQGRRVLEAAARDGSPHAAYDAAILLMPDDAERALAWLASASAAGLPAAQLLYSQVLLDTGRGAEAIEVLQRAAATGVAEADYLLGLAYFEGKGVEQSAERARAAYERAADQGVIPAQFELSLMLLWGLGGPEDAGKARAWERRAAEGGHARACLNLASRFASYWDGERDMAESLRWYERAANNGSAEAAARLCKLHLAGDDVGVDEAVARHWYERAAALGYDWEAKDFFSPKE